MKPTSKLRAGANRLALRSATRNLSLKHQEYDNPSLHVCALRNSKCDPTPAGGEEPIRQAQNTYLPMKSQGGVEAEPTRGGDVKREGGSQRKGFKSLIALDLREHVKSGLGKPSSHGARDGAK